MNTNPSNSTLGYTAAAVAGVAAGLAVGYVVASREREMWKVLGDKSGGAHAEMMTSNCGRRLLKPLDQGERSMVEVRAYQLLQRTSLGPFLCGFHGIINKDGMDYMEIDSAYCHMKGKCATLDIKLGKKTWDDHAKPEKIAKESKKFEEVYSKSSAMDGFRVAGMKAGDLVLNSKNLKERFSLKTSEFGEWLLPAFFATDPGCGPLPNGLAGQCKPDSRGTTCDMQAAREVLGHLKVLRAAAELGFGGTIRASSLLFTREMRNGGLWSLKLIDLAHYTPTDEPDTNFCDGLDKLVATFEAWCTK